MKVAVYTIAKNEEQFVERWVKSAQDADGLFILDTGSSDGTVALAESLGVTVEVQQFDPWRFDYARNAALAMVPGGYDCCIALDMDEVLVAGWRQELEKVPADVTRPRYRYTWSWENDKPGLVYGGDKIHRRDGYVWKHPVHEVVTPIHDEVQGWCGLEIHHFPDHTKSRGQYFPLLELAVAEDPEDDRNAHYLAREYFFNGMMSKAEFEFKRHLSLPKATWGPERAQSMRYLFKITGNVNYLHDAVQEAPGRREAWVDLAQYYHDEEMWLSGLMAAKKALEISVKPLDYICETHAWGPVAHDLAAVCAFKCGMFHEARFHGMEAAKLSPYDQRIMDNTKFYCEAAA